MLTFKIKLRYIIIIFLFLCKNALYADEFVIVTAKSGHSIYSLFNKYSLNNKLLNEFKNVNSKNINKDDGLLIGKNYALPIQVVKFDGKTIRSSIGITDFDLAKKIEDYNITIQNKGLKDDYKTSRILWIPLDLYRVYAYNNTINFNTATVSNKDNAANKKTDVSYNFLKEKIKVKNNKLKGYVFYLISGHGGPDPGAIAFRDSVELHEDEYAYDVTIRLAKKLIESNATVYMIVQDSIDGIRNDKYLANTNNSEFLINGDTISSIQTIRLKQRTDLVNKYVEQNKNIKKQFLLELHVDSRVEDKRIDIFFYHRNGCRQSEKFCQSLYNTINHKYKKNQPGREYCGTISARDLFTLRNTTIPAAYIELGNIQNPKDQLRLIRHDNRQAIANWLYEGIINFK